jgi:hypothetical protein
LVRSSSRVFFWNSSFAVASRARFLLRPRTHRASRRDLLRPAHRAFLYPILEARTCVRPLARGVRVGRVGTASCSLALRS